MNTTTELSEITPLILAGDGYQLTIADEAIQRKAEILSASSSIQIVGDNDDSARAQFHIRQLAAMRIEVEKSRKLVKEPVNRIGKMIDAAAAELAVTSSKLADAVAEVARLNADLTAAIGKLALAQFGDIGGTTPVKDGGESAAQPTMLQQFRAISDPAERTSFYRKH